MQDPDCDLLEYMPMPDFSTGGEIIYRREEMERIVETGLGSFQIRSRWRWMPEERIIEVYEIPYTTKTDVIIERIVKLSKEGKVREIADIRDETDLSGLRIAIDLKRGVDPEKLMAKLYRSTTLQDSFSCNFNVLVDGYPRVMGVRQILHEWVAWRVQSTRRRMNFDLGKKSERLHLLHGLEAILLDIDKAIAIIRGTKLEAEVVPNLMKGFDIDETQAEFVAELKLRNINEEYILNRTKDIAKLEGEIAELEEILSSEENIKKVISDELAAVNKKYVMPRRTGRIEPHEVIEVSLEPEVEEYPVTIMLSRDGYLKKMTDRVLQARRPHSSTRTATSPLSSSRPPTLTSCWSSPTRARYTSARLRRLRIPSRPSWAHTCRPTSKWNPTRACSGSSTPRITKPTYCLSLRTAVWCASHLPDTSPRPTASALRTPSTAAVSCCMRRCSRKIATSRWSRATIV